MGWEEIVMSALWGLVGSLIGVIGTLGVGIWSDKKGYNKINDKVGELNNTTLAGQHNEISNLIRDINQNVKETIVERSKFTDRYTKELYSEIKQISKTVEKNEGRYENLNLDQREVRNNVTKLVNSWETLIEDNKELKNLVIELKKENDNLKSMLKEHNRKIQRHQGYEDDWELER